jgi:hypothetical protein
MGQLPPDIESQLNRQAQNLLTAGRDSKFNRIREREMYSTFLFTPGLGGVIQSGTYDLFKVIKGLQGQGFQSPMTDRETNWPQPNRIADDHNLLLTALHVEINRSTTDTTAYPAAVLPVNPPTNGTVDLSLPPHPADVTAVAFGMALGITFLTNTVPYGLIGDFPAAGGVVGFNEASRQIAAAAGAAPAFATTPAAAGNRAFLPVTRNACNAAFERRFAVPIFLKHGDTFSCQLIVPSPITLLAVNAVPGTNGESNDATGALEVRIGLWVVESFIEHS